MMIRNEEQDNRIYDPDHINDVLAIITQTFPKYFSGFNNEQLKEKFSVAIDEYCKEKEAYQDYFDDEILEEYEEDANAFKKYTRNSCPIIRRCLRSQDEVMDKYKEAFNRTSGREILNTVTNLKSFSSAYMQDFNHASHEAIEDFNLFDMKALDDEGNFLPGVIGYGIQSNFLYMQYCQAFAYRSQDAVWSLFFLSDKHNFDFESGSEFVIYYPKYGTGEQNFMYPPELFAFYSLKIYLLLKESCQNSGYTFDPSYRYVYLDTFVRFVADQHRSDISVLKKSSENVEEHWY